VFGPPTAHASSTFTVLSVFKWELRKGYDVLLQAFLEEFAAQQQQRAAVQPGRQAGSRRLEAGVLTDRGGGGGGGGGLHPPVAAGAPPCQPSEVALYILTKPFLSGGSAASLEGGATR
jgi:hypothetical protein